MRTRSGFQRSAFLSFLAVIALLDGPVHAQGTPPDAADRKKVQADFLAALNDLRKAAGVPSVALDAELSKTCQSHAEYCVRNWKAHEERGKYLNMQQKDLPGYDAKVASAALYCAVDAQLPMQTLESRLADATSRHYLLAPDLKKVGLGWAKGGRNGTISVVDFASGRKPGSFPPVIWPPDKRTDVPLDWVRDALGLLPQDPDQRGGYALSAHFPDKAAVEGASAKLSDGAGKDVDVWVVSLETAPDEIRRNRTMGNDILVIAKDPLAPATTYSVTVKAKVSGKAWSRTWTFTTVSK